MSFSTHFSLSNLTGGASTVSIVVPVTFVVVETVFGGPKNEVMLPFAFGFLASVRAWDSALRLRDMMGRRKIIRRDTLVVMILNFVV